MTTSDPRFWHTSKSTHRMDHVDEPDPVSVQIAGTVPAVMAEAARYNVDHGAQIIDINMGCPAKKVCNAWAGSALMRDEALVARILEAVVAAVDVPVTLKIRTGWNADNRNAPAIARIAEQSGIAALAVHGRTRDQQYTGLAEYDTIAAIKSQLSIPVIANGDIDSPQRAAFVLRHTGCDAVMVGRAAQGRPWLLRRDRALPRQRRAAAGTLAAGHPRHPPRPPRTPACVLRRTGRRAHRAQAPGLVCEGSAGEHRLPRRGQPRRNRRGAAAPDPRLLRRAGRRRHPGIAGRRLTRRIRRRPDCLPRVIGGMFPVTILSGVARRGLSSPSATS